MTWSARITRADGTNPTQEGANGPDYQACQSCRHGQNDFETGRQPWPKIRPCNIPNVTSGLGSILTSVDIGSDGHMACGEAILKCNGYEAIPPKEEDEPDH